MILSDRPIHFRYNTTKALCGHETDGSTGDAFWYLSSALKSGAASAIVGIEATWCAKCVAAIDELMRSLQAA